MDAIELTLWQDHLVVRKGQDIRHGVGCLAVSCNQCVSFALCPYALALDTVQARGIAQQANALISQAHGNVVAIMLNPLG
jgi:hypothetical protein